jgi:lipoprotein-releasing system permease protein
MLTTFEKIVAWRYLRAKRKESFVAVILMFSLLGIALGVATLIVVMSVMNGVRDEMLKNFVGLSGHVQVVGQGAPLTNYQQLADDISKTKGVKSATAMVEGQVMLTANGQARGVQVRAMPTLPAAVADKITLGGIGRFEHGDGILIGERLANNLGLLPGRKVTFISPDGRQTVLGLVPRMKAYTISGIFKFGMSSIDANLVIMPFEAAQTFFKLADNGQDLATGIEVKLENIDNTATVGAAIASKIGTDYRVFDWRQTNAAVFEALNVQRVVMFLILMLIILVAAFNIISSLIMLVKDKQRDIAILRAMGATRGMIQRIFMLSGLAVGALGTLLGLVLGLSLALNVDNIRLWIEAQTGKKLLGEQLYFVASLPAKVDATEVLMVLLMSLTLSLLATLYPARRAAALNPAEALRYE